MRTTLSREDQTIFHSSWLYGVIHAMLSIRQFQTKEAISRYLGLSPLKVGNILEFLISVGLAVQKTAGGFDIGTNRIHLESDSPMISKFHTNWRIQAIRSLDHLSSDDLHYSSAITLSDSDLLRVKSRLVKSIEEIKSIIRSSDADGVHCFSVDFFRL